MDISISDVIRVMHLREMEAIEKSWDELKKIYETVKRMPKVASIFEDLFYEMESTYFWHCLDVGIKDGEPKLVFPWDERIKYDRNDTTKG